MNAIEADTPAISPLLIALFKGVLYQDRSPELWQGLIKLQAPVRDYIGVLGLELIFDEAEGYAYVRQRPSVEGETEQPRLVTRRQLSYPVSLLLVLLRKKLAEHDASGAEPRLILQREQLVDMMRVFLPDTANEARLMDRIDAHINKVVELGFLRRLRGQDAQFEIRRILKAFVDAQWLAGFEDKLKEYGEHVADDQ